MSKLPILYSFRRCPYAMRARMALQSSRQPYELREVLLRDKPACMLAYSPKGTVPVLVLPDGRVIDESIEVMDWALARADPEQWLAPSERAAEAIETLIAWNDGDFKEHLDRYKYSSRYEDANPLAHRDEAERFLVALNTRLSEHPYLVGESVSFVDIAIFPFIRQFANADRQWFDALAYPALQRWLQFFLDSQSFKKIMKKYPPWHDGDAATRVEAVGP